MENKGNPRSIQERRLAIIAKVHQEWAADQAGHVPPDPRYDTGDASSQYPEGVETLSAPVDAHDDLKRRTDDALRAAGLPADW